MAVWQRRSGTLIRHSDQGCRYTSLAFGKRCRDTGVRPSMGSVGSCFDKAMCESFFATLGSELIERRFGRDVPRRRVSSFYILHLLAHLLDQNFHLHGQARDLNVAGL